MNMYLLISYGLSDSFYVRDKNQWFQGLIQGNGAAFPRFLLIAIMLVQSLYLKGLVIEMVTLISQMVFKLAGQIFVDDTNLNIVNKGNELVEDILERAQ